MRWNTQILLQKKVTLYVIFSAHDIFLSQTQELPVEYQVLQEAADTLAFAHSAKMIQYVWNDQPCGEWRLCSCLNSRNLEAGRILLCFDFV